MKTLIAFSSWTGATKEIAERIAVKLNQSGFETRVVSTKENINIQSFDLVIIGTSIHAGQTTRSFRRFLRANKELLSKKQVAYFVACANMMNDTAETRAETTTWLKKSTDKFNDIKPISIGLFGGATITSGVTFDGLNIFIRRIIKSMDQKMISEYGKSDFRDWEKIESWAFELTKIN